MEESVSDWRCYDASHSAPVGSFYMRAIKFNTKSALKGLLVAVAYRGAIAR